MRTLCISTYTKSSLEVQILDYVHCKPPRSGDCYDFLCVGSFYIFPPLHYGASLAYLILSISCDSPILMNMVFKNTSCILCEFGEKGSRRPIAFSIDY